MLSMVKKKRNQQAKSQNSKKHFLFLVILIAGLFITLLQVQQRQTVVQNAQIVGCGDPGDPGNEDGVGKYCTQGGGQCTGTGAPICSADIEAGQPGLCSKPCSTDADCGTGAVCMASTLGSGCEPVVCETTPTVAVPTPVCLGGTCTTPSVTQTQPSPTQAAPSTTTGGTNLLQLLLQLFLQLIQYIISLI
jgi:hypothetical protein